MGVLVRLECGVGACGASVHVPIRREPLERATGRHGDADSFLLDTGWTDMPEGWTFAGDDVADPVRCPQHEGVS